MRIILFFIFSLLINNSFSQNLDDQLFNTEWQIDDLTYIPGITTHCFSVINRTDYEKELKMLYEGTTLKFLDSNFIEVVTNNRNKDRKTNFLYYFFNNRKWKTDKENGKILIKISKKEDLDDFTILKLNENLTIDFINVKLKLTKNN